MQKLMNKENEWHHTISAGVKEGPADCISIDEVAAALKKMKRQKAPGLSGLVAEMIQTRGDIVVISIERHIKRVLILKMVLDDGLLNILMVYAPHSWKSEEGKRVFGTNCSIW